MAQNLMDSLREQAKKNPQRVAFPEADNEMILKAAGEVRDLGVGTSILIGEPETVRAALMQAGVLPEGLEIFDNTSDEQMNALAARYTARFDDLSEKSVLRKGKDPVNCAMMLCKLGEADCVAAGRRYTTADVIRSAMAILGLKPGFETVSSLGILNVPGFEGPEGSLLAMGDCAVNPFPDAQGLADIAISSANTVKNLLGWEPRVAMLAFSTCGSAEDDSIDVILEAVKIAKEREPGLKIDGEFQLDTAIIPKTAKNKMKRDSEVAGRANVLIVPNLHAGNIGVKLVQIFAHADAYGPVLQGFAKPICDFSRSAPLSEMMGNIIMLIVRAAAEKEGVNA